MYILDPRVSDEEETSIQTDVKNLLTANGGEVVREEAWGRRKLAYEIDKLKEGKYTLLYLAGEPEELNIREVELRMRQNDNVLRYLTVRTDEDYKRAGMPLPTEAPPESETAAAEGEGAAAEPDKTEEA
jgi:small subunit ribosomal protein S6